MISKDYKRVREYLDGCENPLFLFDSDCDGLCSFTLLYKYAGKGKGIAVKHKVLDIVYENTIKSYPADIVFALDIPVLTQETIDKIKERLVWIDHHPLLKRNKVFYVNPKKYNKNAVISTSEICYDIVKENLWIGTCGAIADFIVPKFIDEFRKKYPDLINNSKDPEELIYETKIGFLGKILNFNLTGMRNDIRKFVSIFPKIENPYEILNSETPRGKYIYKRYERMNKEYEELKNKATLKKDKYFIVFTYPSSKTSFTGQLAQDLKRQYKKITIIGRVKEDEVIMSIRSPKIRIDDALKRTLKKVGSHGGGHPLAVGAATPKEDFDEFIKIFKKEVRKKQS